MELTITASHTWLLLQVLSSLAQITIALLVIFEHLEYSNERHLEALRQDVPDLITFEPERPCALERPRTQYHRHRRVPKELLTPNGTLSGISGFRPRYLQHRSIPASYQTQDRIRDPSVIPPRLHYGTPRALHHRPPRPDAESEDERSLSEAEDTSSTPSQEDFLRRKPAGYSKPPRKPKQHSRLRSTSYQPSTESEAMEGKPKDSTAKSKSKRNEDCKSKPSASSGDTLTQS